MHICQPLSCSLGWTVRATLSTVTKHFQHQGLEHPNLYCIFQQSNGKVPWDSPEQELWNSSQATTWDEIRKTAAEMPPSVTVFSSCLNGHVLP